MLLKFLLFTSCCLIIQFEGIKNETKKYEGHLLWPQQMLQLKVLQATLNKDVLVSKKKLHEPSTDIDYKKTNNGDKEKMKMKANRMRRSIEDLSMSMESRQLEDSGEMHAADFKRETVQTDNFSRLKNLINLPIQLDVLANVLSRLSTGILDSKSPPPATSSKGLTDKNKSGSDLINIPIDIDAIVNALSNVNTGKSKGLDSVLGDGGGGGKSGGLLNGLLGGGGEKSGGLLNGLLGGGGEKSGGLLNSILKGRGGGGGGKSGGDSGLLGNTLGDLLTALLGGNDSVSHHLGGQDGKGLLGGVLDNLLASVLQLVDNILHLLVNLLHELLLGMDKVPPSSGKQPVGASRLPHISGNNKKLADSLIDAPLRVKALVDILSSLKQTLQKSMDPSAKYGPENLLDFFPPRVSKPKPPAGGLLESLLKPLTGSDGSLINVTPDADVGLNVLSKITDFLQGGHAGNSPYIISQDSNPNEICFDLPLNQVDNSHAGHTNTKSGIVNVSPNITLDLNLLSNVEQSKQSDDKIIRVCLTKPNDTPITPATLPRAPHHISRPSSSNAVNPTVGTICLHLTKPTTTVTLPPAPHTFRTTTKATVRPTVRPTLEPPTQPNSNAETCFYVWVDEPGTNTGNNKSPSNGLINLPIDLDLDVNVLSNVQQQTNTNSQGKLVLKRVCVPGNLSPIPQPIQTTTPKTNSIDPKAGRCFRRLCSRWHHTNKLNCTNNINEYPKITITRNVN